MKKIILFISFLIISCNTNNEKENPIKLFQQDLIDKGLTGSNVAMVYQNGEIVYNEIVNSGAVGDADIDKNTIFAIHSMTKTVTTVAMMILLEQNLYQLDDELSKYQKKKKYFLVLLYQHQYQNCIDTCYLGSYH